MDIGQIILKYLPAVILSVLSACVTFLITKAVEFRGLQKIPRPQQEALRGTWEGEVHQREGIINNPDYKITFKFEPFWRFIKGKAIYELNDRKGYISFVGGFYDQHYLMINYRNKDRKVIQYGFAMFKFSSHANELIGKFLGYGHISEQLVSGNVVLKKKD